MMKKTIVLILLLLSYFSYAEEKDCNHAINTIEINACLGKELEVAEAQLARYLAKSHERYDHEPAIADALDQSQQNWLVYRQSHCDAIYTVWSDGSIRGAMFGECMLTLTKQRTHQIWEDYLTYMDNTPPLLPEPK